MTTIVESRALRKAFSEIVAVDDLSFVVDEGEIFGLIGPNGAGKTTTLRMLTGVLKPDSGTALLFGSDINDTSDTSKIKGKIGIVPQNEMALDLFLTARDNLLIYGRIRGVPVEELNDRVNRLLDLFELTERQYDIVESWSPGMMRRLQIARAFLDDPELIFLDEPSLGLDPYARRKLWDIVRNASNSGATVFLTSHSMDEVNALCSKIAILDHGHIVMLDSPQKLKANLPAPRVLELSIVDRNGIPQQDPHILSKLQRVQGVVEGYIAGNLFLFIDDDMVTEKILTTIKELNYRASKMITRDASLEDVYLQFAERRE